MTKISAARIDLEHGRLDNATLKRYAETLVGGVSGTNTGSAYTADISTGNVFYLVLNSATVAMTFSNPPPSGTYCSLTFILKQDSLGSRQVVWPVTVVWPGDAPPAALVLAGTYSIYHLFTFNGGGRWLGALAATGV